MVAYLSLSGSGREVGWVGAYSRLGAYSNKCGIFNKLSEDIYIYIYIYTFLGVIRVTIDGLQIFTWNANTTFPSVIR